MCAWAEQVDCRRILFTSSISPYGSNASEKDERSLTVPETPYGGSKLVAEKIHIAWQRGSGDRRLVIVRPGVIFGPGEGGNVTRLVKGVLNRYFFLLGQPAHREGGRLRQGVVSRDAMGARCTGAGGRESNPFQFHLGPAPNRGRVCADHLPDCEGAAMDPEYSLSCVAWRFVCRGWHLQGDGDSSAVQPGTDPQFRPVQQYNSRVFEGARL